MKNALLGTTTGTPIEVWFQDEARVGQKGSLTYVWAPIGSCPLMVRDNRHDSAYLFGAICPVRAVGAPIIMPAANRVDGGVNPRKFGEHWFGGLSGPAIVCCRQAALRNRVAGSAGLPGVARRLSGRAPWTGRALMDSRENSGSARWARPLTWPHRQRLPAGDGASTLPGLRGVGDAGKQSAQLDGSRQLTAPVESGADRCGLCLGDDEHPGSMGTPTTADKRAPNGQRPAPCPLQDLAAHRTSPRRPCISHNALGRSGPRRVGLSVGCIRSDMTARVRPAILRTAKLATCG
jgi:hypothetical protein